MGNFNNLKKNENRILHVERFEFTHFNTTNLKNKSFRQSEMFLTATLSLLLLVLSIG